MRFTISTLLRIIIATLLGVIYFYYLFSLGVGFVGAGHGTMFFAEFFPIHFVLKLDPP